MVWIDTKGLCFLCYKSCQDFLKSGVGDNAKGRICSSMEVVSSNENAEMDTSESESVTKEMNYVNTKIKRFCTVLFRILDVNANSKEYARCYSSSAGGEGKEGGNSEIQICADCFKIAQELSEIYEEMSYLELKLDWKLLRIRDLMRSADKAPIRSSQFIGCFSPPKKCSESESSRFQRLQEELDGIQRLRKDIIQKCTNKLQNALPKISLQRTEKPRALKRVAAPMPNGVAEELGCEYNLGTSSLRLPGPDTDLTNAVVTSEITCDQCGREFASEDVLKLHREDAESTRMKNPGVMFRRNHCYRNYPPCKITEYYNTSKFKCQDCRQPYYPEAALKLHRDYNKKKGGGLIYPSNWCLYNDPPALQVCYNKKQSGGKGQKRGNPPKKGDKLRGGKKPNSKIAVTETTTQSSSKRPRPLHKCTKCSKSFSKKAALHNHIKEHERAGKQFLKPSTVERENGVLNNADEDVRIGSNIATNIKSEELCQEESDLNIVGTTSLNEELDSSEIIPSSAVSSSNSKIETETTTRSSLRPSYKCTKCNKSFSKETALQDHTKEHGRKNGELHNDCEEGSERAGSSIETNVKSEQLCHEDSELNILGTATITEEGDKLNMETVSSTGAVTDGSLRNEDFDDDADPVPIEIDTKLIHLTKKGCETKSYENDDDFTPPSDADSEACPSDSDAEEIKHRRSSGKVNKKKNITSQPATDGSEKGKIACEECGKKCLTLQKLDEHKRTHHLREKRNVCEKCGKSYANRRNLHSHIKSAHA